MNSPRTSSFVPSLALVAAAIGVLGCLWISWCEFPFYAWNDVRLAPAFAIRHGINPYPLIGDGPLSTWIYGPVGALVNLPATFAPTVVRALQTAWAINAITVIGPLAVIFFSSPELRLRGGIFPWLAVAAAILFLPRPNLVLQVADHSAIALGLLSCWCLTRDAAPTNATVVTAAVLCAAAIWSKQITLFLLPAQLVYLWLHRGRSVTFRYVMLVGGTGVLFAAIFSAAFGFANLWLNMVEIPGRLGWAQFWPRLTMRPWSLAAQIVAPIIGLAILWRTKAWPTRSQPSGRFFQITALAFATMLPIGLVAFFKIGGDTNLLHSWQYLLPGVMLAWLARETESAAAMLRLLIVVACGLLLRGKELTSFPPRPFTNHFVAAEALLAEHPHRLWFPQNPLITFYADVRLWHSEDGVMTRYLAKYGLREPDFRRHLPAGLEGVVYPSIFEFPFALPLLPEFSRATKMPYWTLHGRPAPANSNATH